MSEKERARSLWGWKTRDDILELLHKNVEKTDELIARKEKAKLTKWHPEFPGDVSMKMYWTAIESTMALDTEKATFQGMSAELKPDSSNIGEAWDKMGLDGPLEASGMTTEMVEAASTCVRNSDADSVKNVQVGKTRDAY